MQMILIAHNINTKEDAQKATSFGCTLLEVDISQNIFSGNFLIQHNGIKGKLGIGSNLYELLKSKYQSKLVFDIKHAKYSLNYIRKFNDLLRKQRLEDLKITGTELKIISHIAKENNADVFYGFSNGKSIKTFYNNSSLLYKPSGFSLKSDLINKELIQNLKSKYPKSKIWCWTVNDKKEIEKLNKIGVDGVVTELWNFN